MISQNKSKFQNNYETQEAEVVYNELKKLKKDSHKTSIKNCETHHHYPDGE